MIYLTLDEMDDILRKEGFCYFKIATYDGMTVKCHRVVFNGGDSKYVCDSIIKDGYNCMPWVHRPDIYDEETYYNGYYGNMLNFQDWSIKTIEIPPVNHTPLGDMPNEYEGKYWITDGMEEET